MSLAVLRELSSQDLPPLNAERFSKASLDVAREDHTSEQAALKIFNPRQGGNIDAEAQALGRMRSEIAVLKEDRPGLLRLLDFSESENWIVTEYCSRGTLESNLHRYKGNAKLALKSFFSLVETVAKLHEAPIVHRDIKPQNIFLGDGDELILGDFGIVFLPNQPDRLSVTGESVGPRDFMPPWAARVDRPAINPTFDVYMLGKVLWCMVAGKMKLHREDFREPDFDLTVIYRGDPDMFIVNQILSKCVVTREADCYRSARDLRLMVGAYLKMLEHGGQLWGGVPKPCRICGFGEYRAAGSESDGGVSEAYFSLALNTFTHNADQHLDTLRVSPYVCDQCGHVQLFKWTHPTKRPLLALGR